MDTEIIVATARGPDATAVSAWWETDECSISWSGELHSFEILSTVEEWYYYKQKITLDNKL